MTAPKPKCFCSPQVAECPKCTRPNWAAMKPSNGDAQRDRIVAAGIAARKLAVAATIVLQVIVWTHGKPTPEEAAKTLAASPGLSNRTGLEGHTVEARVPFIISLPTPTVPRPPAPKPESEQGRANRMGIPGGWTPLEWAILHGGSR